MKFEEIIKNCHVRSAIYRTGDPTKIFTKNDLEKIHPSLREDNKNTVGKVVPKIYWKNSTVLLQDQVLVADQTFDDWEEYDPREEDSGSLFSFND